MLDDDAYMVMRSVASNNEYGAACQAIMISDTRMTDQASMDMKNARGGMDPASQDEMGTACKVTEVQDARSAWTWGVPRA